MDREDPYPVTRNGDPETEFEALNPVVVPHSGLFNPNFDIAIDVSI